MREKLNIGVIGCGWAGEQHARAYSYLTEAKILAVADLEEARSKDLAKRCGADTWDTDYSKILEDPRIDAISICLPHHLHSRVVVEAAKAGKHILCEKPMASNVDQADEMIRATKKAGVTFMIAENVRFHPINLEIKEVIQQDYIGEVFLARIFRDHEMHDYLRMRPWFLNKEKSGGGIWMAGGSMMSTRSE